MRSNLCKICMINMRKCCLTLSCFYHITSTDELALAEEESMGDIALTSKPNMTPYQPAYEVTEVKIAELIEEYVYAFSCILQGDVMRITDIQTQFIAVPAVEPVF